MRFLILFIFLLRVSSFVDVAQAQGIPGADDPALRAAALDWLAERDTRASLTEIGQIAADGNIAARLLANRIYTYFTRSDFPELSRSERRNLFPINEGEERGRFSPYQLDRTSIDAFAARNQMSIISSEEWVEAAEIILAARFRQELLAILNVALSSYPPVNIEAAQFAERFVTETDLVMANLWFFFRREQEWLSFPGNEHRAARWAGDPWSPYRQAAFLAALNDGYWAAYRAASLMALYEYDLPIPQDQADRIRRFGEIRLFAASGNVYDWTEPTRAEIEDIGQLVMLDGGQSSYLRPLQTACATYCADEVAYCMGVWGTGLVSQYSRGNNLEPVISASEYHNSSRAVRELLNNAWHLTSDGRAEWWPMPACLVEASELAQSR